LVVAKDLDGYLLDLVEHGPGGVCLGRALHDARLGHAGHRAREARASAQALHVASS
jgi:hypothetical protein